MEPNTDSVQDRVKDYILREFLPDEDPSELDDQTPLISGGILDSISTVKLVAFLEDEFDVQFQAYEMNADYLDTLNKIEETVQAKQR